LTVKDWKGIPHPVLGTRLRETGKPGAGEDVRCAVRYLAARVWRSSCV